MERKVSISDPVVDQLTEVLIGLVAQVENLVVEVKRHRHFKNDASDPQGGKWTDLNDAYVTQDFDATLDSLRLMREQVEDLRTP